ncbi:hypothetical protein GCM10010271_04570 [Streptomyces kurssanovii]|nr:hypothetical protein GCM10010271_04570 [Streptomyces kurssanovii]
MDGPPYRDDPILDAGDDLLNQSRLADAITGEVQAMNAERGVVVAITGKWGTGKTSLLVEQLKSSIAGEEPSARLHRAIAAFERYAAGWRPREL